MVRKGRGSPPKSSTPGDCKYSGTLISMKSEESIADSSCKNEGSASQRSLLFTSKDLADEETHETTPSKEKCVICRTRNLREGCTRLACLVCCDDIEKCEAHRKPRLQAEFKTSIMEGTHFIQQEAARIRSLRIPPMARRLLNVREPNILYQGDTVVIWDIRSYGGNARWKDDAIRKSNKRKLSTTNQELQLHQSNAVKRLRNNRKRFHRVIEKLYVSSIQEHEPDAENFIPSK